MRLLRLFKTRITYIRRNAALSFARQKKPNLFARLYGASDHEKI